MIEIAKVKEARFYLKADLEWLDRQLKDERAAGFIKWLDALDFGVPKNLAAEIEAYQAKIKPYFEDLYTLKDKMQAEIEGINDTINRATIEVTDEVKKYLPKEEPKDPVVKG